MPESTYGSQGLGARSTRGVRFTAPTKASASASTALRVATPTVMLSVLLEGGSGQDAALHGVPRLHAPLCPQKQHRGGPACQNKNSLTPASAYPRHLAELD